MTEVVNVLKSAMAYGGDNRPTMDGREFACEAPRFTRQDQKDFQVPVLLLYCLNIIAKAAIAQFINESGVAPHTANAIGILVSTVFAQPDFQCARDMPLIDILVAKFHVVCPVLFGIYGDETMAAGKTRCGWRSEGGQPITEQRHAERMTGLGAGWAAVALRNYERSRLRSPLPAENFWMAIARIVNVAPADATQTHFLVLKAMVLHHEHHFLSHYGDFGLVALRCAVVVFPLREGTKPSVAQKAVALLSEMMRKESKLYL